MDTYTDVDRLLRMPTYPGMVPEESRVLRQFIAHRYREYDEWRFNVRLGQGVILQDRDDPALVRSWEHLTKARLDCVAFKHPDHATIIEAKEHIAHDAIWQTLAYGDLYRDTFPAHRFELVCIGIDANPTAIRLAQIRGVRLYLYELAPGVVDIGERAQEASGDAV
jgi:hypothetical protein